jgi:hypothetical protein
MNFKERGMKTRLPNLEGLKKITTPLRVADTCVRIVVYSLKGHANPSDLYVMPFHAPSLNYSSPLSINSMFC